MKKKEIEVGDRVAYSVKFLRSIGEYAGDLPHMRGTVKSIRDFGGESMSLAEVDWDKQGFPVRHVHVKNLAVVGSREFREEA